VIGRLPRQRTFGHRLLHSARDSRLRRTLGDGFMAFAARIGRAYWQLTKSVADLQ
jgi:hypothetical protein